MIMVCCGDCLKEWPILKSWPVNRISERSLYWGHFASIGLDPIFAFITALSLHGIKLSSCWKHFSEILGHALMMPFHSRYWFVNCTSKTHICYSLVARRCSLGLDPSLRWFVTLVCYSAGNWRSVQRGHKGVCVARISTHVGSAI